MNNINLNAGGIIGAILMPVLVAAAVVITSRPENIGRLVGGIGVPALFLGAFGGNYLWERLFTKN